MSSTSRRSTGARAFSLVEMLVVMAVLSILLTGISLIFVETSRVARVQTEQATLQQNQRSVHQEITRTLRMAGIGGLPITWIKDKADFTPDYNTVGSFPNGFAVGVTNNAAEGSRMPPDGGGGGGGGGGGSGDGRDWVMPGSDVLTVRGVFTTPVYYLLEPFQLDEAGVVVNEEIPKILVQIPSRMRSDFEIPLAPLISRIQTATGTLPVIMRDLANPDAYVIMELDPADSDTNLTPKSCFADEVPADWPADTATAKTWCIEVALKWRKNGSYAGPWGDLSMGNNLLGGAGNTLRLDMPTGSTKDKLEIPLSVGSFGILEEFRFYVRADWEVPGDTTSRLSPVLSRAEFVPGTDTMTDRVDIARDIIDLQLAIGIEDDAEVGATGFNEIVDLGDGTDEILFNSADDILLEPQVLKDAGIDPAVYYNPALSFQFVRMTTLAQLGSPTRGQWVPRLSNLEDHDLSRTVNINGEPYNLNADRNVPRAYLQTVIELRNLR